MEISSQKTISSSRLPDYWHFLQHPLVNYIEEIHSLPTSLGIHRQPDTHASLSIYPNPATDRISVNGADGPVELYDAAGRLIQSQAMGQSITFDLRSLPAGIYLLRSCGKTATVVKQ